MLNVMKLIGMVIGSNALHMIEAISDMYPLGDVNKSRMNTAQGFGKCAFHPSNSNRHTHTSIKSKLNAQIREYKDFRKSHLRLCKEIIVHSLKSVICVFTDRFVFIYFFLPFIFFHFIIGMMNYQLFNGWQRFNEDLTKWIKSIFILFIM